MTALVPVTLPLDRPFDEIPVDDAEQAAAAFLARYQGRTLDAYRYDLRAFFQWAADECPQGDTAPDRGLGAFLFAAERFDHAHAALAVLLGLNGLRVSEACSTGG